MMLIEKNNKDYLNAYIRTRKKGTIIPSHIHTNYELVFFFSGEGIVSYDDKSHNFKQGSYYIMPPGVIHSEEFYETGKSIVVWFKPTVEVKLDAIVQNNSYFNITNEINKIKTEIEKRSYGYNDMIDLVVKEIALLISRQQQTKLLETKHDIKKSIDYIDEYFFTQIKISELASDCFYCEDHFRILFKEQTGYSPKDYILMKRINYAKQLLSNDDCQINNLYSLCGFKTYSQFMAFFKKETGTTPKKYRDSLL